MKCNKRSIFAWKRSEQDACQHRWLLRRGLLTRSSVLLLDAHADSQACQRLGGLHQLLMESSAALQHLGQLLQLHVHLVTVVLVDRIHAFLHLLAHFCHLGHSILD